MAQYGVAISNVFDLLDDSDNSQAAAKSASSQPQSSPQVKPAAATSATTDRSSHKTRGGNGNAAASTGSRAGSAGADRGGRGRGSSRGRHSAAPAAESDAGGYGGGVDIDTSRDHSRGGGNRRGRGRGFGDGSRREFDRRGAPRGRPLDQPRKQGLGYGSQLESYDADPESGRPPRRFKNTSETDASPEEKENGAPAEGEETPAVVDEVVPEIAEIVEAVDTSLSFDEWAEQRKAKIPEEDLNMKPREVSIDEKQWKSVVPLNADVVEDDSSAVKGAVKLRKKNAISLDEFVGSNPSSGSNEDRGSRGRGGRGGNFSGERGGRSDRGDSRGGRRGANRGGAPSGGRGGRGGRGRGGYDSGVNVFDDSAFPALQTK